MDAAPYGRAEEIAPGVRRLLAANPSPFTFTGTQTYVVGAGEVAVIDPDPIWPTMSKRSSRSTKGERIAAILAPTPIATTAPPAVPWPPPRRADHRLRAAGVEDDGPRADAAFDFDYRPDRVLADGERVEGEGWALTAVATPGHTSNHLCFALEGTGALFTGDHVMGWSTTVVSPPDGDMTDYMASLDLLLGRDDRLYLPAHGPAVDKPQAHVRGLIVHRRMREKQILGQLEAGQGHIPAMVAAMYKEIDPRLHPAAGRSVLAHLVDLERRGLVRGEGERWSSP